MAKSIKIGANSSRKSTRKTTSEPAAVQLVARPGDKPGLSADRLPAKAGTIADELIEVTGWQRHAGLGALSRLRPRGFALQLAVHAGRKANRLDTAKG